MKLSDNFSLIEFTKSQTAERKGIENKGILVIQKSNLIITENLYPSLLVMNMKHQLSNGMMKVHQNYLQTFLD